MSLTLVVIKYFGVFKCVRDNHIQNLVETKFVIFEFLLQRLLMGEQLQSERVSVSKSYWFCIKDLKIKVFICNHFETCELVVDMNIT